MGISPAPATREQWRFTVALGAAALLCALFALLLGIPLPQKTQETISFIGFGTGGALILVSGGLAARRCGASRRRAWILLTSAAGVALLANLWTALTEEVAAAEGILFDEVCIVIALVLAIAGLLGLSPVRQRGPELTLMVLDGFVVGCAVLVVASIAVYPSIVQTGEGTDSQVAALVASLLDVVLVTVALLLIVRSHADRLFFSVIGSGFLLYAVADLVYAANMPFTFGTVVDLGWIAGYLLLATAAWHPSATEEPDPDRAGSAADVQGTLMVFGILLGALAVQVLSGSSLTTTQTVLWLLLVLAAGTRQTMLTADNAALRLGLEERVREQTSDLRRLARQTEVLLTSVGDGIYGVDPDGRITFINPSGAHVLGYEPDMLLGKTAHDEFHGLQADGTPYESAGCYVTEAIRRGVVATAEEDTYVRADGTTLPVEITASPLVDEDRIRGAVVVFRDVTQRHEVDRMKNEFLSVVSHELRTPLTSIRGSLGLLATGALVELTPKAERMVSIAVESSDRLTRLINDILDIERIESGKLPMNLMPHEAADLVRAAAFELAGLAAASGVRIELAPSEGRVLADADRIVQTVMNLVGNAVKFSPRGGTVQVQAQSLGGDVVFAVHDDGRGIPEDKLQTVFEPFVQVDSSDARQKGGTGLGLAICRGIVERHGGRIWAESVVDEGTTVRFSLPGLPAGRAVDPLDDPRDPAVLVCADDPAAVSALSQMLSGHGFRPIGATSVEDGLQRTVAERPAAILLDMVSPGTAGAELLAELKRDGRTRQVPVIVVSGLSTPSAAEPVTEERLLTAVAAALEGRRQDGCVMVVEDDENLARVLATLLGSHGLEIVHVATVAEAVARGRELHPQVIVLDLQLPDGHGSQVIAQLRDEGHLKETAVLVYSAADVQDSAPDAASLGDTVFLTKSKVTPEQLETRVLRLVEALTARPAHNEARSGAGVGS